jgi:pimeloyl-ACP methyl ester carboxylesterase
MRQQLLAGLALFTLLIALTPGPLSHAQDGDDMLPAAERVELAAGDGLTLVADFYRAEMGEETARPAVILFHMLGSNRVAWEPLLPTLVEDYGFHVLNVDMRGHGETGGDRDWPLAEEDVQTWLDWLREQDGVDPDAVSLLGASIGSNIALRGWANDENVATAIALSPGLDYQGVTTDDAVEGASDRPVMLVASRMDLGSARAVNALYELTEGYAAVRMYDGALHGTNLFRLEEGRTERLFAAIGDWIAENS